MNRTNYLTIWPNAITSACGNTHTHVRGTRTGDVVALLRVIEVGWDFSARVIENQMDEHQELGQQAWMK